MKALKTYLFWMAVYVTAVVVLGALDLEDHPIINFYSYAYVTAVLVVPVMLLIPSLHKVRVYYPMLAWAAIYIAMKRVLIHNETGSPTLEVLVLEFIMIETGVWLSYQLSASIGQSESLLDFLTQSVFPSQVLDLDKASDRIKAEFARSRRYQRPLSLLIVQLVADGYPESPSLDHDMRSHLRLAKIAHAISQCIRQSDLLLGDRAQGFMILCPETTSEDSLPFGQRIGAQVQQETATRTRYAAATFPEEALTFEGLVQIARRKLSASNPVEVPSQQDQAVET